MRQILTPDRRLVSSPIDFIFSQQNPQSLVTAEPHTNQASDGVKSPFPLSPSVGGESPLSSVRSTYEFANPLKRACKPGPQQQQDQMGGYLTPEKYGIGSAHPPLTDRQRVHSGRRERWLSTKEPDAATKAVAIGNNTGNDHDLQQKDPVSIAQGLQEQHKKRFSKQNKPCIPGHEDDDQYFFESPKYILYAMRTYCLSKPIQKFKALFMQYDENSDGSLDTEEIHNGILRMGFDVPLETAVEVMNMIDLDGSASLDFAEFRCAILNERIAQDFEDHTRRMHNDCKLQDAYIERCGEAPYSASKVGPASELSLSEGHWKALNHGKKGMTVKQLTMMDLEEKRKKLHAELARARALDAAKHGAKQSKEHSDFVRNMEQNFKNLRAAFAKMDKDGR